jgi:AraC-like DNA-binding protein
MEVDPLSDTLSLIDARCVVSGGFTAGGTWGLRFWPQAQLKLVAVVRGSCWLTMHGDFEPVLLSAGDVAVVNGWSQVGLADAPATAQEDMTDAFTSSPTSIVQVANGADVAVVGGHIEVNKAGEELLLAALPAVTTIRGDADEALVITWLLERILNEMTSGTPGASFATQQHAQALLVEVLRAHLANASGFPPGWLRAVADTRLAPALQALHTDPSHPWSLEELARLSTMSRTSFVDRFRSTTGVPPITYLQQWRIRLAERELRNEGTSVKTLAARLGYGSESSFSNSFKRAVGVSPRRYREMERAARSGASRAAASA